MKMQIESAKPHLKDLASYLLIGYFDGKLAYCGMMQRVTRPSVAAGHLCN